MTDIGFRGLTDFWLLSHGERSVIQNLRSPGRRRLLVFPNTSDAPGEAVATGVCADRIPTAMADAKSIRMAQVFINTDYVERLLAARTAKAKCEYRDPLLRSG
jgi:hypothetical protein